MNGGTAQLTKPDAGTRGGMQRPPSRVSPHQPEHAVWRMLGGDVYQHRLRWNRRRPRRGRRRRRHPGCRPSASTPGVARVFPGRCSFDLPRRPGQGRRTSSVSSSNARRGSILESRASVLPPSWRVCSGAGEVTRRGSPSQGMASRRVPHQDPAQSVWPRKADPERRHSRSIHVGAFHRSQTEATSRGISSGTLTLRSVFLEGAERYTTSSGCRIPVSPRHVGEVVEFWPGVSRSQPRISWDAPLHPAMACAETRRGGPTRQGARNAGALPLRPRLMHELPNGWRARRLAGGGRTLASPSAARGWDRPWSPHDLFWRRRMP